MKYRYTTTANGLYIPEYKTEGGDEWKPFTKGMIKGQMYEVCYQLAVLSVPRKWKPAQWHFEEGKEETWETQSVFFTKKILVMAFIGAAQHWWGQFETKDVGPVVGSD
jgi:hypothetical protein